MFSLKIETRSNIRNKNPCKMLRFYSFHHILFLLLSSESWNGEKISAMSCVSKSWEELWNPNHSMYMERILKFTFKCYYITIPWNIICNNEMKFKTEWRSLFMSLKYFNIINWPLHFISFHYRPDQATCSSVRKSFNRGRYPFHYIILKPNPILSTIHANMHATIQ